jgi:hypothetical protein
MEGAFLIAVVLLVVIPVGVLISGGIASAILGTLLKNEGEASHPGSELIDTNI